MPSEPSGAAPGEPEIQPETLAVPDGATIAYHSSPGKGPGVVFLGGFRSDMTGTKAMALEAHCRKQGRAFLRFDYTGHGASSGAFVDGTIGRWADDALAVLDQLTQGPQVLVGSSMGGWIMLLVARARPGRIAGLLGLAAAPDFTEDLIPKELTPGQMTDVMEKGLVTIPNCYDPDDPYQITHALLEDGRNHLLLRAPLPITCPVRLIQGMKDADVPWQTALRIQEKLASEDVEITLAKGADHRLSEPHDIARLTNVLDQLLARIEGA